MNILASIKSWFEKAVPHPQAQNQSTQLGVHFEEVVEMLEALHGATDAGHALLRAEHALKDVSRRLKAGEITVMWDRVNRLEFLDSLGDQIVTAVGCGHMIGMDIVGAAEEIDTSNWSKFVENEPVFDENRKIIKGPEYRKPVLDKFV
jgi:hypothetical protein